jgi:hypothetical protein
MSIIRQGDRKGVTKKMIPLPPETPEFFWWAHRIIAIVPTVILLFAIMMSPKPSNSQEEDDSRRTKIRYFKLALFISIGGLYTFILTGLSGMLYIIYLSGQKPAN